MKWFIHISSESLKMHSLSVKRPRSAAVGRIVVVQAVARAQEDFRGRSSSHRQKGRVRSPDERCGMVPISGQLVPPQVSKFQGNIRRESTREAIFLLRDHSCWNIFKRN